MNDTTLHARVIGLYARLCMLLCSNRYISIILVLGFYEPQTDFYGVCHRNLLFIAWSQKHVIQSEKFVIQVIETCHMWVIKHHRPGHRNMLSRSQKHVLLAIKSCRVFESCSPSHRNMLSWVIQICSPVRTNLQSRSYKPAAWVIQTCHPGIYGHVYA